MVYATSDLHGFSLKKLKLFLDKVGFAENDELYILGDVIDRGDFSAELLEWIIDEPRIKLVLGNHEIMMLNCEFAFHELTHDNVDALSLESMRALRNWQKNGGDVTLDGLYKMDKETLGRVVDYLKETPLYREITVGGRKFVLTHSGLGNYYPGKPLSAYSEYDLTWYRPSLDDRFSDEFTTIFGHTPTLFYGDKFTKRLIKTKTWINIDTGSACGLCPMLLRLDDMQAFYII